MFLFGTDRPREPCLSPDCIRIHAGCKHNTNRGALEAKKLDMRVENSDKTKGFAVDKREGDAREGQARSVINQASK